MAEDYVPHLFELKYPTLPDGEEMIWFRHPQFPLQCNQLGLIVVDDNTYWTLSNDKFVFLVKKENGKFTKYNAPTDSRLVYECYHGTISAQDFVFHANDNIYDKSYYNLISARRGQEIQKIYTKRRIQFLDNTVDYMISKSEYLLSKNIEPDDYWNLLALPKEIMKHYRKRLNINYVENRGRKEYLKGDAKLDLAKKCYDLRVSGMSYQKITDQFGLSNHTYTRNMIKFYEGLLAPV
jgi:hypothetical protein